MAASTAGHVQGMLPLAVEKPSEFR
jgi:hypothetical protein